MHTLAKNTHHNIRLIEFCLQKAYPDGNITVERLIEDNLVNGTQVAELAISRTSGIAMDKVGYGMDLEDGSDIKTCTVYAHGKKVWKVQNKIKTGEFKTNIEHVARVTKINSKIGTLRVIAYNPFFEQWWFLIIPNEAYDGLYEVTLRFCMNSGQLIGKYARFIVNSWEELCQPCTYELKRLKY